MITYQSVRWSPLSRGLLALAVLAAVGAGAYWYKDQQAAEDAPASRLSAQSVAARPTVTRAESALLREPEVFADGRPADFSPEDWAALKEAMARTPNPRAELARVVRYLRFQKGVEQWQSLADGSDVVRRRELAQRLLDQVPERLRQSEVTVGEAMLLQATLLADLEPDEALRKDRLQALQAQLKEAAPQADPQQAARDEELTREYKRREAAIVADYQSRPESQRSHEKLEADLDAARRAVWAAQK